jgi:hypothetical protein
MRKKTKEEAVRNVKDKREKRESTTNWIKYNKYYNAETKEE